MAVKVQIVPGRVYDERTDQLEDCFYVQTSRDGGYQWSSVAVPFNTERDARNVQMAIERAAA